MGATVSEAELRRELLEAFEAEYREHLAAIRTMLERGPLAGGDLRDAFRRAHSLKGAARAVDLPRVEEIAHGLETLLLGAVERGGTLPPDDAAGVARALDGIEARMREPVPPPGAGAARLGMEPEIEPGAASGVGADATLRVPAAEIEAMAELVHAFSDAALHRGRTQDGHAESASEVAELLALWEDPGLRRAAADPALVQFGQRLRLLSGRLAGRQRGRSLLDARQGEAAAALQAQLERIALVEADGVFGPLAAMARELAREAGGTLEVRLHGMSLRAARQVLQALRDPAIQLLRNAVSHGLRQAPAGAADGAAGRALSIDLSLRLMAGRLELRVEDDGPGPDLQRIAATARARGLLPAAPGAVPGAAPDAGADERALLALVFEPGFSTAPALDRLSGRGMGLSIVAEAARRLGGTATLRRRDGGGTVALVSVPLAARRQALLLVEAAGAVVALPAEAVERLLRVDPAQIVRPQGRPLLRLAGADAAGGTVLPPVASLATLLGAGATVPDPAGGALPAVLLAAGGRRCAVLVERLHDVSTLLVRAPDLVGIDRRLVAGIAADGRNRPVLVLEPKAVLDRLLSAPPPNPGRAGAGGSTAAPGRAIVRPSAPATVLVVDDSITTRTLEKTILQAQGYRVLVAVDGLAALEALRTAQWEVDVVVADVEMPRLDGFGLLAAMRDDPRLAGIPTVLMTSRNQRDDIRRGLELGARAYLAKQEFDQGTLLATIAQLLP